MTHHEGLQTRGGDAFPQGRVLVKPPALAGLLVLLLAPGEGHHGVQEGQVAPFLFRTIHHYDNGNQHTTMDGKVKKGIGIKTGL